MLNIRGGNIFGGVNILLRAVITNIQEVAPPRKFIYDRLNL